MRVIDAYCGAGGWSAGSKSSFHLLVELAGMTNAGAEGDRVGHYQIDNERVLALSPDVFVVPTAVDGSSQAVSRAMAASEGSGWVTAATRVWPAPRKTG